MNKNITVILILIAAIAVVAMLWPRKKDLDKLDAPAPVNSGGNTGTGNSGGGGGGNTGAPAAPAGPRFPIEKGVRGAHVKDVQRAINANWAYWGMSKKITVDGVFGKDTITALSYDFTNPDTVSQGRYNWIMDRVAKGVPLGRRYVADWEWPLHLGDYDGDASEKKRVRRINTALNVFSLTSPDPRAAEFGPSTKAALMARYSTDRVDEALWNKIITIGFWAPTLNR
jgi:hypothetical protein